MKRSTKVGFLGCSTQVVLLVIIIIQSAILVYMQYNQATEIYGWSESRFEAQSLEMAELREDLDGLEGKHRSLSSRHTGDILSAQGSMMSIIDLISKLATRVNMCGCPPLDSSNSNMEANYDR